MIKSGTMGSYLINNIGVSKGEHLPSTLDPPLKNTKWVGSMATVNNFTKGFYLYFTIGKQETYKNVCLCLCLKKCVCVCVCLTQRHFHIIHIDLIRCLYLALSLCVVISHVVWCILRWRKDKYKEWLHYIYLLKHTSKHALSVTIAEIWNSAKGEECNPQCSCFTSPY